MAVPSARALALVLAAVIVVTSLGGILLSSAYARETEAWRVQAVVQDWVNLVLVVPVLVGSALASRRGSERGDLVLGGTLMYTTYNFVIYGFAIRFNPFFLFYAAALGLSVFALILHLVRLQRAEVQRWFTPEAPVRFPGGLLTALAAAFLVLWLSELVPASLANETPPTVVETGLLTNPVHVLDLSVTLPVLAIGGIALWRRRPLGYLLAPQLLAFALFTDIAIVAIIVASIAAGLEGELAVAVGIGVVAVLTLIALFLLLRQVRKVPLSRTG